MNNNTDNIAIKSDKNLDIKLLDQGSIPLLYNLFYELDISLEKIRIYKAISKDALIDDKVVLTIAQEKDFLVGFNITIINRDKYWLFFAIRHPLITIRIVSKKLIHLITQKKKQKQKINLKTIHTAEVKPYVSKTVSGKKWKDTSPQIAKVFYTGVAKKYRRRGIATHLANFRFKVLKKRGVKRLDATMNPTNIAAIRLNHKLGYHIEERSGHLFATIDLDND